MNGPTIHRTSPQIAQPATISSTMLDVIIALVPALAMAVFLFGVRVLALTAVSVGTCVLAEYGYRRLRGQSNTIGDLSACVTGLLLAMSLPVTAPYWAPVLGGLFAIVIVKQFYGGLGRNFLNPALAGRTLLCTFPGLMTSWVDAFQRPGLIQGVDAASSATPMAVLHTGAVPDLTLGQMLLGQHGGAMGGVPVLMLLLGGLYLVSRRVITPTDSAGLSGDSGPAYPPVSQGRRGSAGLDDRPAVLRRIGDGGCLYGLGLHHHSGHPPGTDHLWRGLRRAHRAAPLFRLLPRRGGLGHSDHELLRVAHGPGRHPPALRHGALRSGPLLGTAAEGEPCRHPFCPA